MDVNQLKKELVNHPDPNFVSYLVGGFENGFDTAIRDLPSSSIICKNNLSAIQKPKITEELLQKEVDKGYVIGPFQTPPFRVYRVSPISLAQKKYSDKHRLVVDLSAPHNDPDNSSLNDLIAKEDFSLTYTKLDEAINIIQELGPKTWLCKTDLVDAFKQIPVHPKLWPYQGIRWKGKYYFYTRLVFGCRSSPKIFDHLSRAIVWIAKNNYGIQRILHLLDDFLTLDDPTFPAFRTMAVLTLLLKKLCIGYSLSKTVGPVHDLEYLGLILDTVNMQCRLPLDKLQRIINMVVSFMKRPTCTKREMLSLCGNLSFATRVIPAGRSFMFRLFQVAYSVEPYHHHVTITSAAKADLRMWQHFLQNWNGVSLFIDVHRSLAEDMDLYTDASGTIGYGGFFKGAWFYGPWPRCILDELSNKISIAFQELYPIVVAAILWGKSWERKRIVFHCDNQGTCFILNKGRSKSDDIMKLMRRLTLVAAKHSFTFTAMHVRGRLNRIADSLSRFQLEEFHRLVPDAHPKPCPIPSEIMFG